jgi:hypothetical protein
MKKLHITTQKSCLFFSEEDITKVKWPWKCCRQVKEQRQKTKVTLSLSLKVKNSWPLIKTRSSSIHSPKSKGQSNLRDSNEKTDPQADFLVSKRSDSKELVSVEWILETSKECQFTGSLLSLNWKPFFCFPSFRKIFHYRDGSSWFCQVKFWTSSKLCI